MISMSAPRTDLSTCKASENPTGIETDFKGVHIGFFEYSLARHPKTRQGLKLLFPEPIFYSLAKLARHPKTRQGLKHIFLGHDITLEVFACKASENPTGIETGLHPTLSGEGLLLQGIRKPDRD